METLDLHNLAQWAAFLAIFGGLWWRVKQRDADRDELVKWRTNTERDIKEIGDRLNHHESRDNRIFDRLDGIDGKIEDLILHVKLIEAKLGDHGG